MPHNTETEVLLTWFRDQPLATQKHCLLRVLTILADRSDQVAMTEIYQITQTDPRLAADKSSGILSIRYFLMVDQPAAALMVYQDLLARGTHRKRCLELLVEYYLQKVEREWALKLQLRYGVHYSFEEADLLRFLSSLSPEMPEMPETPETQKTQKTQKTTWLRPLLQAIIGLPLEVPLAILQTLPWELLKPKQDGTLGNYRLRRIPPSKDDFGIMQSALEEVFPSGRARDARCRGIDNYRYVIDGANILYYADRAVTKNSYLRLDDVISQLMCAGVQAGKIVLVLHQKYCVPKDRSSFSLFAAWQRLGVQLCRTPPGFNDDYFSLYLAMDKNQDVMLVTNDLFRDHIHRLKTEVSGLNLLRQWRREMGIGYYYGEDRTKGLQLEWPAPWSYRVQEHEGTFYIPTDGEEWLIISTAGAD